MQIMQTRIFTQQKIKSIYIYLPSLEQKQKKRR